MTISIMTDKTALLLKTAYSGLSEAVGKLSVDEARDAASQLEDLVARSAFIAEYTQSRRGLNGCGEHGHEDGVKAANKLRRSIRDAMGYNDTLDIRI